MISLSQYLFWLILISLRCKKFLTYDKKTITIIYSNFFPLFFPLRMKKLMYWNLTIWQRERGLGSRHSNKLKEVKILVQHVLVMKIVTLLNKIYARERCFSSSYECERKKKFWVPIRNRSSDLVLWCSTTEPQKLYGELSPLRSSYMIRVLHTARVSRAQNLLFSPFYVQKICCGNPGSAVIRRGAKVVPIASIPCLRKIKIPNIWYFPLVSQTNIYHILSFDLTFFPR